MNGKFQELKEIMAERLLVLDGAMGTMLQQKDLTAADFGGPELEGCNENLVLARPDVILDIHRKYLAAGADIIETDTFGGTPLVLAEYGLADKCRLINRTAAELARRAAAEFTDVRKPRFVAGSIGPTTKAISVTGGVTFAQLIAHFEEQAIGLIEGGVDLLMIETCQDTRNIKAATIGIEQAFATCGRRLPMIVSGTIEPTGTMLAGQAADSFAVSLMHLPLLAIGLNCATGPEFMTDSIRTLHELSPFGISCYPNAGLPNEEGLYLETPESLSRQLERFADNGWLNIVGGCCGTTEKHIAALAQMVVGKKPRPSGPPRRGRTFFSGIEALEATDDSRPILVGERTNVIGSRAFKDLVAREQWEEATDIARRQLKNGAQVVDVCLQSTDREELHDIPPFYEKLIRKIKAPVMIDTTDPKAVELSLTYCQGKALINSINLEDGEERFRQICPLVKKYGAAVVVGCIDEDPVQAQAFGRERKLAVAKRSFQLLTEKYGIPPEDILFDALVFPTATGDANYIGGAVETIEGIRLIKGEIPGVKTILGISNISFGLPPAAREVVNSVFLYHATKAGLDLAIVNAEKLERYAAISDEEKGLAERLLFNSPHPSASGGHPLLIKERDGERWDWRQQPPEQRVAINQQNIAAIAAFYRGTIRKKKRSETPLPLDERLRQYIIGGTKDGLIPDLEAKRKEGARPLEIINGPLMSGMAEVGRLFNANELIVAEVLQSAEAMKAAVTYLEKFMEKATASARGKVLLATVKGDVHDIGKNLVEIILKNNGYEVINLGIKVPPEEIIRASREHQPDIIGLSGLLVKSAQQMVVTAGDLKEAGITIPLLVGGAALSDKFTRAKIAPSYTQLVLYAKDAMTGLNLANRLMDPEKRKGLTSGPVIVEKTERTRPPEPAARSSKVRLDIPRPKIPPLDRRVRDVPQLNEIWDYLNPQMLYSRHLGFKGNFERKLAAHDPKARRLSHQVEEVKEWASTFLKPRAVWQFFEAEGEGNDLKVFGPGGRESIHTFHFPRQRKPDGLCLADYVLSRDHVAIFVVGAGEGVLEKSEEAKQKGEYLKSHVLQALAIETAEAMAEWLHRRIREDWGFPDPQTMTMPERFAAKYRGKRYSFGYPACPDLEDQKGIWKLLKAEEIGVHLTEGMMMEPEASVSALVFHHPDCTYFSVR